MVVLLAQGDMWTQLGIGGIFTMLILREVFGFLKSRNNGNNKESVLPVVVTREEFEAHKKSVQSKDTCTETVKRFDAAIGSLDKKVDAGFSDVKEMISNLL